MGDPFNTLTFNLFARPSFIEGVGRIMDFSHSLHVYNYSRDDVEADIKALHNDWKMVGRDIKSAMDQYGQGQSETRA